MNLHKFFITLSFFLLPHFSQAQLLENLFERAKSALSGIVEDNAHKLLNNGIDYIEKEAGRVVELSSKSKKKNGVNSPYQYVESSGKDIQTKEIEKMIKNNYPFFYEVYQEALRDPLVDKISFIGRDKHSEICFFTKPGTLSFDLYYFEDLNNKKEDVKSWVLLHNLGLIHYYEKNKQNLKDYASVYEFAFRFALTKSREYAKKSKCLPLKFAVEKWSTSSFERSPNKEIARDKIIKTDFYNECVNIYNRNCK